MKKIYFTSIVFLWLSNIYVNGQSCEISGSVVDENEQALEFVTIGVYYDTIFQIGTTTDFNGSFNLNVKCNKAYRLVIKHIGYQEIITDSATTDKNFQHTFKLVPETNILSEVTVVSSKPQIERKADRLIYYVDTSFLNGNNSAYEILKTTPSLWVDGNGGIKINGKRAARVMINGKLLKLGGTQLQSYLNGLDGNQILKVEVISIPGSEYDAESTGGIVNIVVKKTFLDGFNGNLFGGYEQGKYPEYSTGIFSNYKKGKLTTTTNFYLFERNSFTNNLESRDNQATSFNLISDSYKKVKVNNNQVRLGADYDFSEAQNINFEYVRTYNQNKLETDASSDLNKAGNSSRILGLYNTQSTNLYQGSSLNYQLQTDTFGSQLKILLDYIDNDNKTGGFYASDYFNENNILYENNTTENELKQASKLFSGKIDYQNIFTNNSMLSGGIKYSTSDIDNDAIERDKVNEEFVVNPFRTNRFTYTESILAAYLNYSGTLSQFQYKLGLRMENANVIGKSENGFGDFDINYLDWFPSVFLLREFGKEKKNALSIAANRKINRPFFEALNPFEYVINEFTIVKGNPTLRPEYTTNFELGYSYQNQYSLNLFYSNTDNIISRVLIANQNLAIYQTQNIAQKESYGADLSIPFYVIKDVWKSYVYFSIINNHYESDLIDASRNTFGARINNNFKLKKDIRASVSLRYSTKELYGNLIYDSFWQMDANISKSFFNRKFKVSIGAQDIFNTQNNNAVLLDSEEQIVIKEKIQTQKIQLYLFYYLNIGKSFNKKRIEYSTDGGERRRLKN